VTASLNSIHLKGNLHYKQSALSFCYVTEFALSHWGPAHLAAIVIPLQIQTALKPNLTGFRQSPTPTSIQQPVTSLSEILLTFSEHTLTQPKIKG
jgi:hypothetical protein